MRTYKVLFFFNFFNFLKNYIETESEDKGSNREREEIRDIERKEGTLEVLVRWDVPSRAAIRLPTYPISRFVTF